MLYRAPFVYIDSIILILTANVSGNCESAWPRHHVRIDADTRLPVAGAIIARDRDKLGAKKVNTASSIRVRIVLRNLPITSTGLYIYPRAVTRLLDRRLAVPISVYSITNH